MEQSDERMKSRDLAQQLRDAINDGTLESGEQLDSYRKLADVHRIAVNTAREAIRMLEQEGLVEIHQGRGAFVAMPREEQPSTELIRSLRGDLEDVQAQLRQAGKDFAAAEQRLSEVVDRVRRSL